MSVLSDKRKTTGLNTRHIQHWQEAQEFASSVVLRFYIQEVILMSLFSSSVISDAKKNVVLPLVN
jgi:hypothetical protein